MLKPGGVVVVNVSAHDQDIVQHVPRDDGRSRWASHGLAVPQTVTWSSAFSNSLRSGTLDGRAITLEVALGTVFTDGPCLYHRYGTRGFLRFQSQARQQLCL